MIKYSGRFKCHLYGKITRDIKFIDSKVWAKAENEIEARKLILAFESRKLKKDFPSYSVHDTIIEIKEVKNH